MACTFFFPPPPTQKESVKLKIQFLSTNQKVFNLCILYHLASILVLKVVSLFYGTSQNRGQNYSIISFTFNKWPFSLFMSVQQKAKWSFSAGGQYIVFVLNFSICGPVYEVPGWQKLHKKCYPYFIYIGINFHPSFIQRFSIFRIVIKSNSMNV